MIFFLNSGNVTPSGSDQCRNKSVFGRVSSIVFLLLFFWVFGMLAVECECHQMEKIKKAHKLDNSRPGEVFVQSKVLTVKSFNRKLEERGTWKNAIQKAPELGRSETLEKTTEKTELTTLNATTKLIENETNSLEENQVDSTSSILPTSTSATSEATEIAESDEITKSEDNDAPNLSQESEKYELATDDGDDFDQSDDAARSAEESVLSAESQEMEKLTTSPKTTARTIKPTPTLKLIAKSVRTTYPFLKKVPSRLVAKPSAATQTTQEPKRVKTTSTKKPLKKGTKPLRPATPVPEHFNPHHPHGVVVFDKRKRRPKPGRTTTVKTTTTSRKPTTRTTTTTTTTEPPTSDEGSVEESISVENLNIPTKSNSSSTTKRPGKVPLSKLAMAMIASSTNFDDGSNAENLTQYPKTPVNLLHLLQAYTKQMHLANSQKVEALAQPVRIQSTPFMLHLSQLNFAAKLGISIYYSLIAIIPLVYLAFGGLGRIGFLNGVVGKKRRRKRSTFNEDENDERRNYFKRKAHFQFHARGGSSLRRGDLRDDDGNEEEYAWIMRRISEIMLEFSMLSKQANK